MYLPRIFQALDAERIHDLIEAHSFATVIAARAGGDVEIAHVPVVAERLGGGELRLLAHVARANPLSELVSVGARATVLFHGPDAYVSPSWYEEPSRQVPTWNYAVVHAQGRMCGPFDKNGLSRLLDALITKHERNQPRPWRLADLERELFDELVDAIVGFSIAVERVEAKFKLSQNRSDEDRLRVRARFEASADPAARALALLMRS